MCLECRGFVHCHMPHHDPVLMGVGEQEKCGCGVVTVVTLDPCRDAVFADRCMQCMADLPGPQTPAGVPDDILMVEALAALEGGVAVDDFDPEALALTPQLGPQALPAAGLDELDFLDLSLVDLSLGSGPEMQSLTADHWRVLSEHFQQPMNFLWLQDVNQGAVIDADADIPRPEFHGMQPELNPGFEIIDMFPEAFNAGMMVPDSLGNVNVPFPDGGFQVPEFPAAGIGELMPANAALQVDHPMALQGDFEQFQFPIVPALDHLAAQVNYNAAPGAELLPYGQQQQQQQPGRIPNQMPQQMMAGPGMTVNHIHATNVTVVYAGCPLGPLHP